MARQYKPLPIGIELAPTLARRVNQLRDCRNLTVRDLGRLSSFGVQRIEDIEGGVETWLSTADRQLLAKALNVEPQVLQEVETRQPGDPGDQRLVKQRIAEAILAGERELPCPNCGGKMKCTVREALDIEGKEIQMAKAFCMKCPFVLK